MPLPEDSTARVVATIDGAPLVVDRLIDGVRDAGTGAIAVFLGLVRDHDGGRAVSALDYSEHPSAADRLEEVAHAVAARHDVRALAVSHRVGALTIGDLAVVVAAGAAHRGAAFEACRDLIDTLKAEVPIWKNQSFADGAAEWVGLP